MLLSYFFKLFDGDPDRLIAEGEQVSSSGVSLRVASAFIRHLRPQPLLF